MSFIRNYIIIYINQNRRQPSMSKQYLMIRKEFLREENYEFLRKNSIGINHKYEQICTLFERRYEILKQNKTVWRESKRQFNTYEVHPEYQFIAELKRFIQDFTNIISQVSNFQIECLQNLKINNKADLDIVFQLKEKVGENKAINEDVENKKDQLIKLYQEVKQMFANFKKNVENPLFYYQREYVNEQGKKLMEKNKQGKRLIEDILKQKQIIQSKIQEFQPCLTKFKCKLVKNKYKVLKKLVELIQNSKYCQIQMIGLLRQCALNRKREFKDVMQHQHDDISYLKKLLERSSYNESFSNSQDENKSWQKNIHLSIDEFSRQVQNIQYIFYQILAYFNNICNNYNFQHEQCRMIITQIHEYYDEKQSPLQQLIQLMKTHEELHRKFTHIIDRLNDIIKKILCTKSNCKKKAQIILSLLKVKKVNNRGFLEYDNNNNEGIQELMNNISFAQIKLNILMFYDSCIVSQNQMLETFNTSRPRRKTLDSMDISHSVTHKFNVNRKTPLREQIWLWKEWKQQIQVNFQGYQELFDQISLQIEKMSATVNIKQSSELQKYECQLINNKSKGILKLKIKCLEFSSNKGTIIIGLNEINNVSLLTNFFQKGLSVQTNNGKLNFAQFEDPNTVINSIKELQQKNLTSGTKKLQKKKKIQLKQQQINFILERKQKIKAEIPTTDGFKLITQQIFEDETIDQMYEIIYSDKPFNFYGREQPCFFSYTGKKSGNFNWVAQKFDKPGPQFYSLQPGVNFTNCPLYSTRYIKYNHPMKPTPIPFMPKSCSNKDQRKLYWISHEQFVYMIKSVTEGVPFADTFYVELQHRLVKVQKGVKLSIYSRVVFVQETSFKGVIFSSTDPEIDQNMLQFIKQIKRLIKLRKDIQKGQKVIIQKEQPIQQKVGPAPQDQVSKLRFYNKILIFGFAFLILINIINSVFF